VNIKIQKGQPNSNTRPIIKKSAFNLAVGRIVIMGLGDFSCTGSVIMKSASDLTAAKDVGMTGGEFFASQVYAIK
jgi:hypothetical protein